MKSFILFTLALLFSAGVFAQSTITVSSGLVYLNGKGYGASDVTFVAYSSGTIELKSKYDPTGPTLTGKPTSILNGTTGVYFASMDELLAYLVSGGVGYQAPGTGGSGGGGGGTDVSLLSKETTQQVVKTNTTNAATNTYQTSVNTANSATSLASIDGKTATLPISFSIQSISLTTSYVTLSSASCKYIEFKNNGVGAVDIYVKVNGGTISETIPANSTTIINYINNTNLVSVAASSGTPTVTYRIYN